MPATGVPLLSPGAPGGPPGVGTVGTPPPRFSPGTVWSPPPPEPLAAILPVTYPGNTLILRMCLTGELSTLNCGLLLWLARAMAKRMSWITSVLHLCFPDLAQRGRRASETRQIHGGEIDRKLQPIGADPESRSPRGPPRRPAAVQLGRGMA